VKDLQRIWYAACLAVARVLCAAAFTLRVYHCERLPADGGVLVIANHQSYLDPILVAVGMPRPFHPMARATLFRVWPFAWLIRSLYAFPVRRASADFGAVREALRRLKDGQVVLMFPEGTRTLDGSIGPLQGGPTLIAARAGVPIVPMVIDGALEAWPRHRRLPRPHTVRVAVGEPLRPDASADPEAVMAELRVRMLALQAELRGLPRDAFEDGIYFDVPLMPPPPAGMEAAALPAATPVTIEVARGSGVCFGVRRALELAEKALAAGRPVYSLGPLIHNPQEVSRLAEKGFRVIESLDEVAAGGTLLIRSHGLGPDVVAAARQQGLEIIDATCPLVHRAQTQAAELEDQGFQVVVAGDEEHPEVRALLGHAPGAKVVGDPEALARLDLAGRVALVAQTTFSPQEFQQVADELAKHDLAEARVLNTICAATVDRQRAAADLAGRVDVMFVIGGRNSANTNRLAQLCAQCGVATHHVEQAAEVRPEHVAGRRRIGVAAGASTPQWIIDDVCAHIRCLAGIDPDK
jgi:(E)-4-hydroxy-3-methyl-but-2-enyl pyrophosphate reductase